MSNLVFRVMLSGLLWETVVRSLELHERTIGVGDGRIKGYRYIIIQRGDKISIILPDNHSQDVCHELAKEIIAKLKPESSVKVIPIGHSSSHCNYCLKLTPLPYRCHRCNNWYCDTHRLPERHNCPGRDEGRTIKIRKSQEPKKVITTNEILVFEVPCG